MAIPVNMEDFFHKRKIEFTCIEFKTGWSPDKIYRTICAFSNNFDSIGGGYCCRCSRMYWQRKVKLL